MLKRFKGNPILEPIKVLFRSKYPILEPEQEYEEQGYVANIVFTC
ncbi:unnamed protein product, partial [marine sediment metagenome]